MFSNRVIGLFSQIPVILYNKPSSVNITININETLQALYYDVNTVLNINNEILVTGNPDNTKIIDSSLNNFTLTSVGSTSQGTFSPFNPYPKSAYFNGSSFINTQNISTFDFSLSSTNFTIEAFIYSNASATIRGIIGAKQSGANGWALYIGSANTLRFARTIIGSAYADTVINDTVIPLYKWTHIALVKDSTGYTSYVNGISGTKISNSNGLEYLSTNPLTFGNNSTSYTGEGFLGYISDFRITKGQALYTTNFIPPSTSLTLTDNGGAINVNGTYPITPLSSNVSLLTLQDPNLFIDKSTNNFTLSNFNTGIYPMNPYSSLNTTYYASSSNGGNLYFNGTNSFLSLPSSSSILQFGTNPYTVEFWTYLGSGQIASIIWIGSTSNNNWSIGANTTGGVVSQLYVDNYGVGKNVLINASLDSNRWYHIAVVRSSISTNGTTFYVNGSAVGSGTDNSNWSGTTRPNIGGNMGVNQYWVKGYISDLRVTKGQALYTTNFTPPSAPLSLTANGGATPSVAPLSSNISLYLEGANANILDSTLKNNIIVAGATNLKDVSPSDPDLNNKDKSIYNLSATAVNLTDASTSSIYAVSGFSGFFRGSNCVLTLSSNSQTAVGSSDFTIEFWAYFINARTTTDYQIVYSNYTLWAANAFLIGKHADSGGCMSMFINNFGGLFFKDPSLPPNNVWTHYAFVRSGSTFSLYRDGFRVALSGYNGAVTGATNPSYIGSSGDSNVAGFQGNIADFRITKGQALYTSNFTPPSRSLTITDNGGATPSVLPLSSNVAILTLQSQDKILKDNSINNFSLSSQNIGVISVNPYYNNINEISAYGTSLFYNGFSSNYTGGYITIPTNTQTALSSLDFTIEFWAYFTFPNENIGYAIYSNYTAWTTNSFYIAKNFQNNNHKMAIWSRNKSNTVPIVVEPTFPPSNKWTHYAFVRTGSTFSIYRDGTLTALSGYNGSITGATNPSFVGNFGDDVRFPLRGFLSDFRLTKGQALYTTNFTPPTSMLSLTDNGGATPSVLPLSSNVGLLLNNFVPSLTTNNKSIRFPENGFLQIPNINENLTLGSSDFTIEFKLFLIEPYVLQTVIDQRISAAAQARLLVTINESNAMVVNINNVTVISNTILPIKKWTQYSIFKNGDILGLAINNTTDNYIVSTIPTSLSPTNGTRIGTNVSTASASPLIGYIDDFKVIKGISKSFTSSQYFIETLIIGGGGAGGSGGGGGAGGFVLTSGYLNSGTTYAITVGAGGTAGVTTNNHTNGSDSILDTIGVAYGGGAGGTIPVVANGTTYQGANGASGGGSGSTTNFGNTVVAGGTGIAGQGNNGGRYVTSSSTSYPAAGGGGAGAVGGESSGTTAGSGGIGKTSTITGTSRYYSGGGGGGVGNAGGTAGSGGLGGGGNGCTVTTPGNATNGTANTGGGGGGRIVTNNNGTNGGSGIVIIKYLNSFKPAIVTGNPTITSSGNYRIYSFTGSGTINIPK